MAEALMKIFKTMTATEQKELYDFANFLISKKQKKEINPLEKFCGILSDEDATVMLNAIGECRRVESSEW